MNRLNRLCVVSCLVVAAVAAAGALSGQAFASTTCENPLFIQRAGADANVLIVLDNSGSMNEPIYHPDYDANTNYSGKFNAGTTYYISTSGNYTPRSFNYKWSSTPSAYLVTSDNGEDARYDGNYLNWIYFHATAAQIASVPRFTRIQVAKDAVHGIITNTDGVQFGLMDFNYDSGGKLLGAIGTSKSTLHTKVNAVTADAWTPLAETLVTALAYFQKTDSSAPIQYSCQKNFIVIVTDGYPTMDLNVPSYLRDYDGDGNDPGNCASLGANYPESNDCSDYMDDVAKYLHDNDMRSDMDGNQNIDVYTIGFTLDAPILQATADNGGGLYFNADDSDELIKSLNSVLTDIISKKSSGTAVSVVSTESSTTNRIYRAKFMPGQWIGYLEAFNLPYSDTDVPVWKAESDLLSRDPNSRMIYTSTTGTDKIDFDVSKLGTLQPLLNTADSDSATDIINYIRGEDITGYRNRNGYKLGDIVDSSPVTVGDPSHFYDFLDYSTFRTDNTGRDPVLYIGANDGMLHCFSTVDGQEKWGYIPKNVLGRLKQLMDVNYCHQYYVNLTPKVVDAYVGGAWKTILLGGEREGGDGLFALDVTDPTPGQVKVMWDVSLPIAKQTWSVPEVIRDPISDSFVCVLGSGPNDVDGKAYLITLSLEDGSVISTDQLGTPSASMNMATSPVAVDRDLDGYDDLLYVADLAGNLWRYDLTQNPWSRTLLFHTSQPIQAKPVVTVDEMDNVLLYFGTGRYMVSEDLDDTSQQTFYCIIDNHSGSTVQTSNLVDQTSSITKLTATDRGWYIDLVQAAGERITKPDAIAAGTVYFTSFQPNSEICSAGGHSWLYAVDFRDGSSPDNDDGTENDTTTDRVEDAGDGLLSDPVLDIVNENIIVQSSDTDLLVRDTRGNIVRVIVRSWRQLFQ
jgi:type IV pilus assembly protein PilY1